MKIKELIEDLKKFNEDAEVYIGQDADGMAYECNGVFEIENQVAVFISGEADLGRELWAIEKYGLVKTREEEK